MMKQVFSLRVFILVFLFFDFVFPSHVFAQVSPYPITGTFFVVDQGCWVGNEAEVDKYARNMRALGIETLITIASSWYGPVSTPPDCLKGQFSYLFTFDGYERHPQDRIYNSILDAASRYDMKLFLGVVGFPPDFYLSKYSDNRSDYDNPNTCAGKYVYYSIETIEKLKTVILQKYGQAFWDRNIKGFYLDEDVVSSPRYRNFIVNVASRIKAKYPDKKIIISPYKQNNSSYYNEFKSLYLGGVDIIAPQDSLGTGLTSSLSLNSEHFKQLQRAALETGKEAWANVETFRFIEGTTVYKPASFDQILPQIESSRPYVSKQITWIFQHTLGTIPSLYQCPSWSNQYIPEYAIRRQLLRNKYIEKYNSSDLYVSDFFKWGNSLVAKGNLGGAGKSADINLIYISSDNQFKTYKTKIPVYQEDKQTVYLDPSSIPGFSFSKPHVVFVNQIQEQVSYGSDLNSDGKVDIFDYNILVTNFGKTGSPGFVASDINKDGKVDIFDYNILVSEFGR